MGSIATYTLENVNIAGQATQTERERQRERAKEKEKIILSGRADIMLKPKTCFLLSYIVSSSSWQIYRVKIKPL